MAVVTKEEILGKVPKPDIKDGIGNECGEGASNSGSATVWAGPGGEKLSPSSVLRPGLASFLIPEGAYGLCARHGTGAQTFSVWKYEGGELTLIRGFYEFEGNRDEFGDFPEFLGNAADAVWAKAEHYHCRCLHYAEEPQARPR